MGRGRVNWNNGELLTPVILLGCSGNGNPLLHQLKAVMLLLGKQMNAPAVHSCNFNRFMVVDGILVGSSRCRSTPVIPIAWQWTRRLWHFNVEGRWFTVVLDSCSALVDGSSSSQLFRTPVSSEKQSTPAISIGSRWWTLSARCERSTPVIPIAWWWTLC